MKIFLRIIITFAILPFAVALFPLSLTYLALAYFNANKRPKQRAAANGFMRAEGRNLYDGNGNLFQIKGVNLGNWFVPEDWMCVTTVGNFETGVYTQRRGIAAMRRNPNLSEKQIYDLYEAYMQTYITEEDFEIISKLGLNTVRIPFTYMNLSDDGKTFKADAFKYLDWAIEMCKKYNLFAILDLHGAPGSQNQDQHSGDDSGHNLYGNAENQSFTVQIWETIAKRYKDNKTVAAYDLLNEPRKAYKKFASKMNFDFYDRLYRAIRKIDSNHLILIECFTFPTHGTHIGKYKWNNVCMQYHIYNLTPFSQLFALRFYNAAHNFMRYRLPVYIGEWNAFSNKKDWIKSLDYFDKMGWSYSSWTYKSNKYFYSRNLLNAKTSTWGIYELDIAPVDISTANYEEILNKYLQTSTANAKASLVFDVYNQRKF